MDDSLGKLESDLIPHFQAWKDAPGPFTSGNLLRAVTPVLHTAVKSYGGGNPSPLLHSRARQMALKAFNTYDPYKGTLKTHLLSQLQGLRRVSAQEQNIISAPEAVLLDYQHLIQHEHDLADKLGRSPSDMEVSDSTGLSAKRLAYIRQYRGAVAEGAAEHGRRDEESGEPPASQAINFDPDEAWTNFIYHDLTPVDQTIADLTLGRNGNPKLSVKEIAQRLGITPSAVSQRTTKIQKLIDSRHSSGSII